MLYKDPKILLWLKTAKRNDICPIMTCDYCNLPVRRTKHAIQQALSPSRNTERVFCSSKCQAEANPNKAVTVPCGYCNVPISVQLWEQKRSKSGKSFCSSSCAASYNNTHKSSGTRRSKLESFLESRLVAEYPDEVFEFNTKEIINSELDIYLPNRNLAFELNGLFHYEPIFGTEKLAQIKNNDQRKFQACLERGIELCIINTSEQLRFTEASSLRYLKIITEIINMKIGLNG